MIGEVVGKFLETAAGDAIEKLITFLAGWVVQILTEILNFVGTWWLKIGAPSMGEGSATERIQTSTVLFVGVAGVFGTAFALIKIARDQDRNSAENLVMGMVRTILTTAIAVPMVALLFAATDELAPWLVRTISGSAPEDGLGQAMGLEAIAGGVMTMQLAGVILFVVPLALLGAILNALIVIFSYGMAIALCGVLPIFAAASQTERGRKSFDKAVAWLAAVVLFKPTAAILYGAGLALLKGINGTAENELGNTMISLITGLVVILSASVAMPALAKVLVPAISAGPQGMGASGLAMLGGALALGAVTAGVGAAGMAAAGSAGGAGTAGTAAAGTAGTAGTAAASEAAGTAGTTGAASADGASGISGLSGGTGSSGGPGGAGPGGGDGVSGGAASSGGAGADGGAGPGGDPGSAGEAGGSAGGPTGAEQQVQRSGAPGAMETGVDSNNSGGAGAESGAGGSGGPIGAERQTASSGAPAQTEGGPGYGSGDGEPNGSGGGPVGAEPSAGLDAPSSGSAVPDVDGSQGPAGAGSESPTAQGYRDGAPGGAEKSADKSGLNRQRVEFALRDAAKDIERGMESGNDV